MTCTAPCPDVEILDDSGFDSLADAWIDLTERTYDNRLFVTHGWHSVWRQYFSVAPVRIVTSRDDRGTVQGILPLQIEDHPDGKVLTLLGDFNVCDYMDALADKDQAQTILTSLWARALDEIPWDRVNLRHVPSGSPLLTALESTAKESGFATETGEDEVCPVASLSSSWDDYLQALNKKQRHEIRRKLRRAQEGASYTWRTVQTHADLDRDLPVFFRLHEASAHDKARFMTQDMREFFCAMAAYQLDQGTLRLSVFTRDGADVATTMSFLYGDQYLLYNSGYDPAYAAHSPGISAVALSMQHAIEEHAVAFDFLSGDEPYKYQFGASNTHTCRSVVTKGE